MNPVIEVLEWLKDNWFESLIFVFLLIVVAKWAMGLP